MRSMLRCFVAAACIAAVIVPSIASATVITVRSDGTGDYSTVAAAVTASSAGDSIEVGPGTYVEPGVKSTHALTIYSTNGAAATTLDSQSQNFLLQFNGVLTARVVGLRFYRGHNHVALGVFAAYNGAVVTMEDCIFEQCQPAAAVAASAGQLSISRTSFIGNGSTEPSAPGAVYASGAGTQLSCVECEFTENLAGMGGGVSVLVGASAVIDRCTFTNNQAEVHGAALNVGAASAKVSDCLFEGNRANAGTTVYYFRSAGTIERCTFYRNEALVEPHAALLIQDTPNAIAERNIFYGSINSYGLEYLWGTAPHACNLFWANAAGAILGDPLAPTDVESDPIFCDAAGGDFHVSKSGPADPAQSACGQQIGAFPSGCDIGPPPPPNDAPVITSIEDVPDDQGRAVRIKWEASDQDARGTEYQITGYAIYRFDRMLEGMALLSLAPLPGTVRDGSIALENWDYLTTVPARGDDIYQVVVPTLGDKELNVFFVSALTPDPLTFFDSEPDTGYSVDNVGPGAPANFSVVYGVSGGVELAWTPPEDEDVVRYRVYRSTAPSFTANASCLVAEARETQWVDTDVAAWHYYKVSAVDKGDNEGPAAVPSTTTGAGGAPIAFRLGQNEPNPFNPSTMIPYGVGMGGGRVTLRVYDVTGALVRTLVDAVEAPGLKKAYWNGADERGRRVASGTYFYRLTAPGYEKTLKMTIVK